MGAGAGLAAGSAAFLTAGSSFLAGAAFCSSAGGAVAQEATKNINTIIAKRTPIDPNLFFISFLLTVLELFKYYFSILGFHR
jgi:hypothetical protein